MLVNLNVTYCPPVPACQTPFEGTPRKADRWNTRGAPLQLMDSTYSDLKTPISRGFTLRNWTLVGEIEGDPDRSTTRQDG